MKLSEFNFKVPKNLIALNPTNERDESKLMIVNRKDNTIKHEIFKNIINYFNKDDVIIFNDTKVFSARMYGTKEKTTAEIEVFLLRELNKKEKLWDVLVNPARKIRVGNKIYFNTKTEYELSAAVIDNTTSRGRTIKFIFDGSDEEFKKIINSIGVPPLPDYISKYRSVTSDDYLRYQTLYADKEGSVAVPSAGLHFSNTLLKRLELRGVIFANITLHIGIGTFKSVEVEDLSKHKTYSEKYYVSDKCVNIINNASKNNNICIVGVSTMKAIESSISASNNLKFSDGWTNKFIFPPYNFNIANSMITNFHPPKSSLYIMVSAFGGYELIKKAYAIAIKDNYRFYSYGDAMLII
ncbi:MAG: tRNA preQ1(34) S-adenosylmethionine ribosyltransferase-isomerase QueA [Bacteroides sp.]|nr:MAG: tRNA preQ1(34) S-adenosylmethionine ribosyltransferase-isomerase QueA [Bacteroides sp.]